MSKWPMVPFADIFEDCTSLGRKIPKGNYLSNGKFPIVDQGKGDVIGFSNDVEGLFEDVPAIVFGDHTRALKLMETPFFLGADGVKVLKAKQGDANYRYLFFSLNALRIPDLGYNRHFKFLKQAMILLPSPEVQNRIVAVLSQIGRLETTLKEELENLNQLVKSRYLGLKLYG